MNNLKNLNNNLLNNQTDSGKITILLVVLGVILLVFVSCMVYINYKRYNQYKIQDFVEEEILSKALYCKNKLHSTRRKNTFIYLGNEYCMNMWLYINDYNYKYGEVKYVLMKGNTTSTHGYYNSSQSWNLP